MSRPAHLTLFWRLQLLGWLLFAVATFPLKVIGFHTAGAALVVTITREPLGFLLSSGLGWFYSRFHRRTLRSAQIATLIIVASISVGAADMLLGRLISGIIGPAEDLLFSLGIFCFRGTLYIAWSLLYFWIKAQRAAQERELNLARAETISREAELQLLRTQVNPHFLFNALNTIVATLEPDQVRPRRVVEGLAAYLRYSLSHRHDSTVPLGTEYDAAIHYLAVEQERFRGELVVESSIDEAAREFPVPGVLIQPLVENAVKYSRQTSEPPYRVRLLVTAPDVRTAVIEVANAGTWVEPSSAPGPHGSGVANLRRRLALLYPERHQFEIAPAYGWVTARLTLYFGETDSPDELVPPVASIGSTP